MLLQDETSACVFLDVDELENLDNLNFTVRSNTENLVVLLTAETLSRFWCAVEIVSAFMHGVPILMVAIEKVPLDESFLDNVTNMWSEQERAEFLKVGITPLHVQNAYRHLCTLLVVDMPFCMSNRLQRERARELLANAVNCPANQKTRTPNPEQVVYLCHDTLSWTQACVAQVLCTLFEEASWTCHVLEGGHKMAFASSAIAVVLISAGLSKNPTSLGFVSLLARQDQVVPVVTVISQEDFSKPDAWIKRLREDSLAAPALSLVEWELARAFVPAATGEELADGLSELFKILAWRFNPQDTHIVMQAEFMRILERVWTEFKRGPRHKLSRGRPSKEQLPQPQLRPDPGHAATSPCPEFYSETYSW